MQNMTDYQKKIKWLDFALDCKIKMLKRKALFTNMSAALSIFTNF